MVEVEDSELGKETDKRKQEFDQMLAKAQEVRDKPGGHDDAECMIFVLGQIRRGEAQLGRSR